MKASRIFWIGVLFSFVAPRIHCLATQRLFIERSGNVTGTNASMSTAVSEAECALNCIANPPCRRYAFIKDQKRCYVSRDTLDSSTTGGTTVGRYCPRSKGYENVWIGGRECCIKVGKTAMNYTDGLQDCMLDGAHLFTLEGPSDVAFIKDRTDKWSVWIDGAKTLATWYGEPLPWTNPVQIQTPQEGYCIVLNPGYESMIALTCHTPNVLAPVCQIDL